MKQKELVHLFAKNLSTILLGIVDATKDSKQQDGGGMVLSLAEDTANTIINATLDIINGLTPTIEKAISGKYATMTQEEALSDFIKMMQRQVKFYKAMSENEEVQKVLRQLVEAYVESGMNVTTIVNPKFDIIMDKLWEMIEQTVSKSVDGTLRTAMNAGTTAITTIPVLGPSTVAFITFIRGISRGMESLLPSFDFGVNVIPDLLQTWTQVYDATTEDYKKIKNLHSDLNNVMENSINETLYSGIKAGEDAIGNANLLMGGKSQSKKIRRKINRTSRRLSRKIRKFTQKAKP